VTQGDSIFHWLIRDFQVDCFYGLQYPVGEQAFAVSNQKSMEMKLKGQILHKNVTFLPTLV